MTPLVQPTWTAIVVSDVQKATIVHLFEEKKNLNFLFKLGDDVYSISS